MISGEIKTFAIESEIARAFIEPSLLALGYFVIHVKGEVLGVKQLDASLLACSLGEVESRIERRGRHVAPFAEMSAVDIAAAVRNALYADEQRANYFGMPCSDFVDLVLSQANPEAFCW